jgi:transposase
MTVEGSSLAAIGIDAAIVANHRVAVRGDTREDFAVAPTLAGLAKLTERLAPYAGSLVVAEPTGMSWLSLSHAAADAGCDMSLVQARHSAKLRSAIAGKNKTDVIDADMLTSCAALFGLEPTPIPGPAQIALRRSVRRRHAAVVDAHRGECRLWGVANWAFPDLWRACGGHGVAQPLLARWPHLDQLGRARSSSVAEIVAAHTRSTKPDQRADKIQDAARGWARFWAGRLDLDAVAWEITELLADINAADERVARAATQATTIWKAGWGDDEVLLSIRGLGPMTACHVRAWMGDCHQFSTAKQAGAFTGLNPSNWESGLMVSPSRPITKEGPPDLRLALYQAANVARQHDPQLAEHYRRLMVDRGHNHMSATTAVARKLTGRIWAVLNANKPYVLRDLEGNEITDEQATELAVKLAVPEDVRKRSRARNAAFKRGRLA